MAERKQIALIYDYDVNWIGGTYYILNIIKAIKFLPDAERPHLTIYHDKINSLSDIENINYPYITFVGFNYKLSRIAGIINNICLMTIGKEIITVKLPSKSVENFYYRTFIIDKVNIKKYYTWVADLQDLYLPQFFKKHELKLRLAKYKRMVDEKEPIVFSSNAALDDFNKFYPNNVNLKRVVRFVSISTNNFNSLSITDLKSKFKIEGDYIIVSNQFWRHKNHMVVLEAFRNLVINNKNIQLVLTGKEYDYRDPNYTQDLKNYVTENNLQSKVLFLGFIDRDEQLKLMSESLSIIQPSLFEGWSTVVEDAKFLKKCIICSDIPVHREQLPESDLFFDPYDPVSLTKKIEGVLNGTQNLKINYNHQSAVLEFARNFINIF
jgi:glycosyltransferase involved in cell wall biosynthesis